MADIDPAQERMRLAQIYASRTDGELAKAAAEAGGLTDLAREALQAEISRRGLGLLTKNQSDNVSELGFRDLVTVRSFWSLPEANLARGLLEAVGIESFLFDENIVGLALYINAVRGVTLRVDRELAEEADQVLRDWISRAAESGESESSG